MVAKPSRRVVLQPAAHRGMQRGINQIAEAVRPTLGPVPRIVAVDRGLENKRPELLDNGGVIARRIVALPDRDADMGAMLLRSLLWRLHERHGDGTATAAMLFQSVFNQGVHHVVSGGDAMRLRGFLETGIQVILGELAAQVTPVRGQAQLTRVAEALCYDRPLARTLGEIFDVIGEHGQLEITEGRGRGLEREYVEGSYWKGGVLAREMFTDRAEPKVNLEEAAVFISDLELGDPRGLLSLVELAKQAGRRSLVIVGLSLSEASLVALRAANREASEFKVMAVKTPGLVVDDQIGAIEDLAVLTGGRPRLRIAGQFLSGTQAEELGHARRAWADRFYFGIVGGKGDPRALRRHLVQIKAAFAGAEGQDSRERLQGRIGKLLGGAATLRVGGATEAEIAVRKELAERTAAALRGALMDGVLPGGGASLLACCPALQARLEQSADPDEQAAYRILIWAMEAPLRTIVANAGGEPSRAVAEVKRAGPGCGFDVLSGRTVNMQEAGIVDVGAVQKAAVRGAISSAALALTVDVLVHRKRPPVVYNP